MEVKRYPERSKKLDDYSPLANNLSKEKRKRDVGFDVAGKWLRLKFWQLIYDKMGEDDEEEEKEEEKKTISIEEE